MIYPYFRKIEDFLILQEFNVSRRNECALTLIFIYNAGNLNNQRDNKNAIKYSFYGIYFEVIVRIKYTSRMKITYRIKGSINPSNEQLDLFAAYCKFRE